VHNTSITVNHDTVTVRLTAFEVSAIHRSVSGLVNTVAMIRSSIKAAAILDSFPGRLEDARTLS
jgi:hypothetical protein